MNKIKINKWLIISLSTTLLILLLTYALKGLYPFGETIFNTIDFDTAYIPVYYKFWDIIHLKSSMLFDWNLGAGLNCYGSLLMNGLMYPTSWLILLFNRDYIPNAMNLLLIIKILNMNLFAFIALDKIFPKLEDCYKSILSLFYTFSGWTLIMCGSLLYIDVVSLFPIFILTYYNFIKKDKWIPFVSSLTLVLIICFYQAWMYLFFIIGSCIIIMLVLDIKDKKKKCVQISLMVFTSLLLSMITFLPSFYQVFTSYRMTHSYELNQTGIVLFFTKLLHILPLGALFSLTTKQLFIKKDKKINLIFILLIIYTLIGVFVEPINKLWHSGSYSDLPFRYSYIPTFILTLSSAYYLTYNKPYNKNKNLLNLLLTIVSFIIFIMLFFMFKDDINKFQISIKISSYIQPLSLIIMFILGIIITYLILLNNNKTMKYLLFTFTLISTLIYTNLYINISSNHSSVEAQKIKSNFNLTNDGYNYVVNNYYNDIGDNFPYILEVPSIHNWLHFIKEDEINFKNTFNYGSFGTTYVDSNGGNLLLDYLINNKYFMDYDLYNKEVYNDRLYQLIDKKDKVYLYKTIYNGNYITPYDGTIYNEQTNFIDATNNIYKMIYNKKEDILHRIECDNYNQNIILDLKPNNVYYIEHSLENARAIEKQLMDNTNDTYVSLTDKDILNNRAYIKINVLEDTKLSLRYNKYTMIAYINIDEFIEFAKNDKKYDIKMETNKNKRTYQISLDEDKSVLVPINYDDAFTVLVNGEKTKYTKNIFNMFSIDLKKGDNKIDFIYHPKFIIEGILITLGTLLMLIVIIYLDKKIHLLDRKIVLYPLFIVTCLFGFAFIFVVYFLSWIKLLL